jgi:hypothetical protein
MDGKFRALRGGKRRKKLARRENKARARISPAPELFLIPGVRQLPLRIVALRNRIDHRDFVESDPIELL